MFKKVDVIFFVEHKDRELDSYIEVAKYLKEKNLTSLILSNFFHMHYLYLYKPRLVIWNNLTSPTGFPDGFLCELYPNLIKVSHRWEQVLAPFRQKFKTVNSEFEKEEIYYIAWNNEFKNLLESYGVNKKNIYITGCISTSLLYKLSIKNNDIKEKLSKEKKLVLNKEWIFLPMNYAWAFMKDDVLRHKINNGYSKDIAEEFIEYTKKCLEKFVYFVDELSKLNYEIIVRPHPSITIEQYEEKFKSILGNIPKNVLFDKSYSIREWIIASDIIGSSWSTAVYDAFKISKKCFYFTPYKRPLWLNRVELDEVENISCVDEIKKIKIKKIKNDDIYAIESFAKTIENLLSNQKKFDNIKIIYSLRYVKYAIKFYIKNILCKYFKCFGVPKWQHYDWFNTKKF